MKQVILFLSNKSDQYIIDQFNLIASGNSKATDIYFLYHQQKSFVPEAIKKLNHYVFTSDILHELGYIPLEDSLIPGSCHFPLMKFYLENRQYDYYWFIEDDVYFSGEWVQLFDAYEDDKTDFISSFVKSYVDDIKWPWWSSLNTGNQKIRDENKIHSFNPIYRLSNSALNCIDNALKSGWIGHNEVLLPTLLYNWGFTVLDMGGLGKFVKNGHEGEYYTMETMSHLPISYIDHPNYLYHPIKEKRKTELSNLKKNCVIAAVGGSSLHKHWINERIDFDLHLIVYDNSFNKYYNDADFISSVKGSKFKLIYGYLHSHPEYLKKYEYFLFPDDDILMNSKNISELFIMAKKEKLQICQPALIDSYYTYEHTLRDKYCQLRYTNFVEMMIPCFSRKALKKVLMTFNENSSGWGIEYHWAKLINFRGKEMAVIDRISVTHTRPIQSSSKKNRNELAQYIQKYNLSCEIKETGIKPIDLKTVNLFIKHRIVYSFLDKTVYIIINFLLQSINKTGIYSSIGLSGLTGVSLLLVNYSLLSGKRSYIDAALVIIEKVSNKLDLIKDDMSFRSGLLGFSLYIENIVQLGVIENNVNEILEEVYKKINDSILKGFEDVEPAHLNQLSQHYFNRTQNSELRNNEKEILFKIIDTTHKWMRNLSPNLPKKDYKEIIHNIMILDRIKEVFNSAEMNFLLCEGMNKISSYSNKNEYYLLKLYIMSLISKGSKNEVDINEITENIYFKSTGYEGMLNIYLLHQLYIHTRQEKFRLMSLRNLYTLIYESKDEKSFFSSLVDNSCNSQRKMDPLIRIGLMLTSILSDKDLKLDNYILWD